MGVAATMTIEAQLSPGVWTNLTPDTVAVMGLRLRYGVDGSGPADCLAGTGELSLGLRNDAGNSGAQQGWYSPSHASKRSGWTFGIPVRVQFTYSAVTYTKFRGKIRHIDAIPGQFGPQRVSVVGYDVMRDLMEADVRDVTLQVNKTEAQLLTALLDALETESQPVARSIDAGVDTYPWAFDDVGRGRKAAGLAKDVIASAYGLAFVKGDGTFTYKSRQTRATGTSVFTLANIMHGLAVPASLERVYNRVRVTIHPKQVSSAATDELYTLPTGTSIEIPAGGTREVWTEYTNPNERTERVGGTEVVTALVAGTHYAANSSADGSGTDLTGSITASLTAFASTGKWSLTNTSTQTAFIRTLKVVGKAVRDPGPQTFESFVSKTYGDRQVDVEMPYQDDADVGNSAAVYIRSQYDALEKQFDSITFVANDSDDLMTQALAREPGDRITITETVTGFTAVDAIIHSVELEVKGGVFVHCRWGLAPVSPFNVWQIGVAGQSELGVSTVLGF